MCHVLSSRRRPSKGAKRPYTKGFTLIEMMVTVAVAAIIAGVAVPALRTMVQNNRQYMQTQSLWMSLNLARSESRKRDVSMNVCPSTDGLTCTGSAADWPKGWIVVATGAAPAMSVPPLAAGSTLSEATPLPAVTFYSNGMVAAAAAFTVCDSRGASMARSVEVTLAGRVSTSTTPGKRLNGAALACP